jgi:pilus assembly protein CpaF
MTASRSLGFIGVKGGVGTSLLAAHTARTVARNRRTLTALVDFAPEVSSQASYLALNHNSRPLSGLKAYEGTLGPKILGTYFAASPEGVLHVPVSSPSDPLPLDVLFSLLEKIRLSVGLLVLDLPSFSGGAHSTELLRFCQRAVAVTSTDPLCLASAVKTQPVFAASVEGLAHLRWAVNQVHPKHPLPKDAAVLPSGAGPVHQIPYGGDDLGLSLRENRGLPSTMEKAFETMAESLLDESRDWKPAFSLGEVSVHSVLEARETGLVFDLAHLARIQELHQKLLKAFREQGLLQGPEELGVLRRDDLEPRARAILDDLLNHESGIGREDRERWIAETFQLAFGLGPLEPYLQDETVTEIMVNGPQQVYVERRGKLEPIPVKFLDDSQLRTTIERILAPIGRRLDESQPYVDGRLSDGSRINAVLPPISLGGPILTIRKFSQKQLTAADLVRFGSLTPEASTFLGSCVKARKNIVVSGGTGSGKTTLLNVLSCFIPTTERIVTIEDSAELKLSQDHVVRMEARPANLEGKGRIAIRDLVINALRMRPDRIVVGEVRGGEALDMLQAMNTGHDGSLTTCHANTPRDALTRLEIMCLMAGLDLPLRAVREQVVRAVHLIVQQSRLPNGKRAVTHIAEIRGLEGEVPVLQDLFKWNDEKGILEQLPFRASFDKELQK